MKGNLPWSLTARWIFPVDGPPVEPGVVTIHGERIVAIEPRGKRKPDVDLGDISALSAIYS